MFFFYFPELATPKRKRFLSQSSQHFATTWAKWREKWSGNVVSCSTNNFLCRLFLACFGYVLLDQWFSTFLDSWHRSFVIEQFGGTPCNNISEKRRQVHKHLELFTAP